MIPGGQGGSSLASPPGDPAAIRAAAGALNSAAAGIASTVQHYSGQVSDTLAVWQAEGSQAFEGASQAIRGGVSSLGQASAHASTILSAYASALEAAQQQARSAQAQMAQAEQAFSRAMTGASQSLRAMPAAASAAVLQQAQQAADQMQYEASDALRVATGQAETIAGNAMEAARQAGAQAAAQLASVAAWLRGSSVDDWVTRLGAAGLPFEGLALGASGTAVWKVWQALSALQGTDFNQMGSLDPKGWQEVEDVAAKYGDDSLEALNAQLKYMEELPGSKLDELVNTVGGMGPIPEVSLPAFLDVVGKLGLGVGAVGDTLTLFDGQARGVDKVIAGANLAGIGAAALGTDTAATILASMGAADAIAGWVPVAGQVLIGVTAVAAAGMFVYEHWSSVEHAASDVFNAAMAVPEWELHTAEHLGTSALHTAESVGSAALSEGSHIVSGAVHTAENLVSDLNPF